MFVSIGPSYLFICSDGENEVFFEHRGSPAIRRSVRIPELQQRKHEKFRSIIVPEYSPGIYLELGLENAYLLRRTC
jgi:hypothetical protein